MPEAQPRAGLFASWASGRLALHPNAHGKAREREIMNYLVRVANRFRDKY